MNINIFLKNKKRILFVLMLIIVAAFAATIIRHSYSYPKIVRESIISSHDALTPIYFFETGRGGPSFRMVADIKGTATDKVGLLYAGKFLKESEKKLQNMGYDGDYGQILFYEVHGSAEVFVYCNWYKDEPFYRVFHMEGDNIKEYHVPLYKGESLAKTFFDGNLIYLLRGYGYKTILSTINVLNADITEQEHTSPDEYHTFWGRIFYFPETNRKINVIFTNDKGTYRDEWFGINIYDFNDYSYQKLETELIYTDVFLLENGNYLFFCSTPVGEGPVIDIYTPEMQLISRKRIELPKEINFSEQWGEYSNEFESYLIDGRLYFLIKENPNERGKYYHFVYSLKSEQIEKEEVILVKNRLPDDNWMLDSWEIYQ